MYLLIHSMGQKLKAERQLIIFGFKDSENVAMLEALLFDYDFPGNCFNSCALSL